MTDPDQINPSNSDISKPESVKTERIRIKSYDSLNQWTVLSYVAVWLWKWLTFVAIPVLLAAYLTKSEIGISLTLLAVLGLGILFSCWGIDMSAEGLHLRRLIGKPRLIMWNDVRSIENANPWKLILFSLFPFFPKHIVRGLSVGTISFATKNFTVHVRPRDLGVFLKQVATFTDGADIKISVHIPDPPAEPTGTIVFGRPARNYLKVPPTLLSLVFAAVIVWLMPALLSTLVLLVSFQDLPVFDDSDLQLTKLNISEEDNSFDLINGLGIKPIGDTKAKKDALQMSTASWDSEIANEYLDGTRASIDLFYQYEERKYYQNRDYADPLTISIDTYVPDGLNERDIAYYSVLYAKEKVLEGDPSLAFDRLDQNMDFAFKKATAQGTVIDVVVSMLIISAITSGIQDIVSNAEIPSDVLIETAKNIEYKKNLNEGLKTAVKVGYQVMDAEIDRVVEGRPATSLSDITAEESSADSMRFYDSLNSRAIFKPNRTKKMNADDKRFLISQINRPCGQISNAFKSYESERSKIMKERSTLEFMSNVGGELLYAVSIPFHEVAIDRKCENEFRLSATQVLLAIKAYKNDTGDYPPDLATLVPKYLPRVPEDPYSGGKLKYSKDKKIIYAVGDDLKDEGGSDKEFPEDDKDPTFKIKF